MSRPVSAQGRTVFVRVKAPHRHLSSCGVIHVVANAAKLARPRRAGEQHNARLAQDRIGVSVGDQHLGQRLGAERARGLGCDGFRAGHRKRSSGARAAGTSVCRNCLRLTRRSLLSAQAKRRNVAETVSGFEVIISHRSNRTGRRAVFGVRCRPMTASTQ